MKSHAGGDMTPKQKRLLREALEFLESTAGSAVTAERTLKNLFAIYEEIDPFSDYIRPGEREFFPVLRAERTLERFLEGFKYVYYILRRAEERLRLGNLFDNFWARCTDYLAKCGYSEKYISDICGPESIFYRQSFAWWRREYGDREEGFRQMYEHFRACFGVEGNDDYCAIGGKDGIAYDWRRMKACCEREKAEQARPETVIARPEWEEWSEKNRKRMRELIESLRRESAEAAAGPPEADPVLAEIRRRNRERGIFA
ncbi:MAG TPA: hypothetical protein VHC46_07310 [Thermodesulfobacteriota bacterium]|nr:hypothetical protein [Thermodesulfobacteriota bacterium]